MKIFNKKTLSKIFALTALVLGAPLPLWAITNIFRVIFGFAMNDMSKNYEWYTPFDLSIDFTFLNHPQFYFIIPFLMIAIALHLMNKREERTKGELL
ncbi:hypothetical protein L3496_23340 [Klebsiella pneumoniae]|uniref:hypothetical protein n=1 Tax=Klebsiella pneumoniae TaxID=573 RepID=UPI001794877C|nr:hypothetical protein [Klebsiella pneumoniae]EAV8610195.1 hypothetical protein [Salmonella enterica]EFM2911548.1 hypothetical protein [Salmonella enterica subsp. enterica serovar Infantis]EIF8342444.1 hypothetical protein [Salmonella enterica subsp. enterica serovar Agona]EHG9294204.1 hypothetical protein [Salmonella enterica]MDG0022066.1 hypothetical protein [Klebsiella pneumoniae]